MAEKVFPCSVLVGTFKETRGKKNSIICAWKYLEHSSFDSITVHLSGECSICYETSVQGFIWHMNRSHVIDVQDFTDTTWTNATAEGYENTKKIRENFHLFLMCRYIWRNEFATQYIKSANDQVSTNSSIYLVYINSYLNRCTIDSRCDRNYTTI